MTLNNPRLLLFISLVPAMTRDSIFACLLAGALPVLAATLPSFLHTRDSFKQPLGLCETDKKVQQYSGYIKVEDDIELFFWFFEARKDPDKKPLVASFAGGPGLDSTGEVLLLGPCTFDDVEGDDPKRNDFSFTEVANMIFIDQPVGVGFSKGSDDKIEEMDSTDKAAPLIWKFFQELYKHKEFSKFKGRDTGIMTSSYGGHYGPAFASYMLKQKASKTGVPINLRWLAIDSGSMDLGIMASSSIDYAYNNSYKKLITKPADYDALRQEFTEDCAPLLKKCKESDEDDDCEDAAMNCMPFAAGDVLKEMGMDFDKLDVSESVNEDSPWDGPKNDWLSQAKIGRELGAEQEYAGFNMEIIKQFYGTGDPARSSLSTLGMVAKAGVAILLTAGDKDLFCNHKGVQKSAESIDFKGRDKFARKALSPWKVNGNTYGEYKTEGSISYLNVKDAGHGTFAYQPAAGLAFFRQFLAKDHLVSEG
ncbi:Uu.00g128890.m01.CDS01 [Anthostomella pinea]|uniref:Uu.00g128890.m01.CDS01 n=1 Tax=Anthostomella pinea TaxID=933095 RepID=A0AAI8VIE4_9PEZI|nr:Uu.00g128890.m01.CDS01 [Anthostomella pinea]